MESLNVQWITAWDEAFSPQLRQLWKKYYDASPDASVFAHPAMGEAWLNAYRPLRELKPLFCIAEIGQNQMFYPLVLWRRNWKNVFQQVVVPVGFSDFDYLDPLIIRKANSEFPVDFIHQFIQSIFKKTLADEVDIDGIRDSSFIRNGSGFHQKDICPQLQLTSFNDFPAFLQSLKSSLRGDLNRQQRRLFEFGNFELKIYSARELSEIQNQLPYLLEYHHLRFPHSYQAKGFHEKLVESASLTGLLHFSTLMLNGRPISWHLGFCERGRFYYYLPATDPGYAQFSTGKIHLLMLNKWAIENGVTVFDHLRGEENYKAGWTDTHQVLYRLKKSNSSLISRFRNTCVNFKNKL